jgi:CheY-like chemotaxis protein
VSTPIAVIEDDHDILDLLIDFLADYGIEAVGVAPRLEAIRTLPQRPGAVLVDLMLPGISGIDVAREVQVVFPGTPMLAMSASRLMLDVAAASGLFDAHLSKPFDLSLLLESARAALAVGRYLPSFAAP